MRIFKLLGYAIGCAVLGIAGCSPTSQTQFGPTTSSNHSGPGNTSATENVLYSFGGSPDINGPIGGVVADAKGNLYGTATNGGAKNWGGVFRLTRTGSSYVEDTLYTFNGGSDGGVPWTGLYINSAGSLYGTTLDGGISSGCCGTVFELTPYASGYTKTTLYTFQGGSDGSGPTGTLIADSTGALYGITQGGGDASGDGTVYKLTPSASGYSETVLYRFQNCRASGNSCDGASPNAGLYRNSSGALFGTTLYGGEYFCTSGNRCGTVFELAPTGSTYQESVIHYFTGGPDGANPQSVLIADKTGNLYGTTTLGGGAKNSDCNLGSVIRGCGTIFKLSHGPKGYKESVLYAFQGGTDGAFPQAGLIAGASGDYYGTTQNGGTGGAGGFGTVFELVGKQKQYSESVLYTFQGQPDGQNPRAAVIDVGGVLYGTTYYGGQSGYGSVFDVTP